MAVLTRRVVMTIVNVAVADTWNLESNMWIPLEALTSYLTLPVGSLLNNDTDIDHDTELFIGSIANFSGLFNVSLKNGTLKITTDDVVNFSGGGFDYAVSDGITTSDSIHVDALAVAPISTASDRIL
jgi:hypothetical protein